MVTMQVSETGNWVDFRKDGKLVASFSAQATRLDLIYVREYDRFVVDLFFRNFRTGGDRFVGRYELP